MSFYAMMHALFLISAPLPVDTMRPDGEPTDIIMVAPLSAEMDGMEQEYFQNIVVQERIMIRVPAARPITSGFRSSQRISNAEPRSVPRQIVWQEKKAPRCIPMRDLVGVQFVQSDGFDLVTRDKQRLRASLKSNCRAANFYSGFYMKESKDGMMCAGRDMLQSRSGTSCTVERFRKLVPAAR